MSLRWSRRAFLRATGGVGAASLTAASTVRDVLAAQAHATAGQPADVIARDEAYWRPVQQAFDVDRSLINLNNGNSSPSPRPVEDALRRYLDFSNRLPVVYRGQLEERLEDVRKKVAAEFGCDPDELALTRNATESLQIAQNGLELNAGDEVVTTDQDYARMLWQWDLRARRDGIRIVRIQFPVPTTADDLLERFERAMTPRTRVLHFCHMTNVTGQLFPVRELSRLAHRRGAITIVDGAHSVAHVPINLHDLECDVYGTSLHKWLAAPHGTGFLYVRKEVIERIAPMQASLGELPTDIHKLEEIGTYTVAARSAIADALAFHQALGTERKAARLRYLTLRWAKALQSHPRVRMLSNLDEGQTWGLAMFTVAGMNAPDLERALLMKHRTVAYGMVSQRRPGPVFDFNGLRVTPSVYTTPGEIDRFVEAVQAEL